MQALKSIVLKESKTLLKKVFDERKKELLSEVPGRLKDFAILEMKESSGNFEIEMKVSPLALELETGTAYDTLPNLGKVTSFAVAKGIGNAAIPIWVSLSHKRRERVHRGWTEKFEKKIKEALK